MEDKTTVKVHNMHTEQNEKAIRYVASNMIKEDPKIAITFDGGPSPAWTPQLLDGLKERNVKATFFLIGANTEQEESKKIVKRMYEEGHLIGNHTYTHCNLSKLETGEAKKELERAELRPGEEEELEARKTILRSADQLVAAVEGAYGGIFGDEDRDGAASLLAEAESSLAPVMDFSSELAQVSGIVADLRYTAEDAAERLRDLRSSLDFSPSELDAVESRLDQLHRLKKKYGASVQEMLSYLSRSRQELEQIEMADDTLLQLKKKRKEQLAKTRAQAEILVLQHGVQQDFGPVGALGKQGAFKGGHRAGQPGSICRQSRAQRG